MILFSLSSMLITGADAIIGAELYWNGMAAFGKDGADAIYGVYSAEGPESNEGIIAEGPDVYSEEGLG